MNYFDETTDAIFNDLTHSFISKEKIKLYLLQVSMDTIHDLDIQKEAWQECENLNKNT